MTSDLTGETERTTILALLEEMRQRLINTERKVNFLLEREVPLGVDLAPASGMERWGSRTFAQHGDDMIALALLDALGISRPFYVDIGAHHPFNISNTALMYALGARGVNVEPNPALFEAFPTQRPQDVNLNFGLSDEAGTLTFHVFGERSGLNTFDPRRVAQLESASASRVQRTMEIEVKTYREIAERHFGGRTPDFVSLDVEGMDLRILKSMNLGTHRPALICVEANTPSEAGDIKRLMIEHDYRLAFRAVVNLFFVDARRFPAEA